MPLDWDIKLDAVSIRDEIVSFSIRDSKGSYVRELTLFAADPTFYGRFVSTELPTARIEVLTKIDTTWISQGFFFVEKPVLIVNPDSTTSPGVWGRSLTAQMGPPFATKISKAYDENTSFATIIAEMEALTGITITSEADNYAIMASSYVVDGLYPIDVITELAGFAAAYLIATLDGELLIKDDIFHPSVVDHTIIDVDIADISESIDLPDFGNRIRISAVGGVGSGYGISLEPLNDSDCLPADGTTVGTFLAFVTDAENEPVPDNTIVNWEIEDGATLTYPSTATGDYLLSGRKQKASNFYEVDVDFPIKEVIGIWAYSDSGNKTNLWDENTGSFDDKTITVGSAFAFCDQTLRITYITSGCAVNTVTAGTVAIDVELTVEFEGVTDSLDIKLGNTCACGSSLNMKVNPSGSVCFGNMANVLVWGTIYNQPAVGAKVTIAITSGCGQLSDGNMLLANVEIIDEASYVENVISGTSQVKTEIAISSSQSPAVYLETDTSKNVDLYSSFDGKVIDLNTELATGTKVVITYAASGATLVNWQTNDITEDCDSEVSASMHDGTEAGQHAKVSLRTIDCTVHDSPPDDSGWSTSSGSDDQGSDNSGGVDDPDNDDWDPPFGNTFDPCLPTVAERILNAENVTSEDEMNELRFGVQSTLECEDEFSCPCSELCLSETNEKGSTYDYDQTIHEITIAAGHEDGTPAYNEAFETERLSQLAECEANCASTREVVCGECQVATDPTLLVLAPGDSMEVTCSDGISGIITMPEGTCGTQTFTVGCCTFEVRSTDGTWVMTVNETAEGCYWPNQPSMCICDVYYPDDASTKCWGQGICCGHGVTPLEGVTVCCTQSGPCPGEGEPGGYEFVGLVYYCQEWQCN